MLLKDVGAPSTLVKTLGIEKQKGSLFCGQVRWAHHSMVSKENAQPFVVNCKQHIYGAQWQYHKHPRAGSIPLPRKGTICRAQRWRNVSPYRGALPDIEIKKRDALQTTNPASLHAQSHHRHVWKTGGLHAAVIADPSPAIAGPSKLAAASILVWEN